MPEKRFYEKPSKSASEIIGHWESRGLKVENRELAIQTISRCGYYRLLIYARALQNESKIFRNGTTFKNIVELYEFDAKLRLLCLEAVDKVEVALRAAIINGIALEHGPHFYENIEHFSPPENDPDWHQNFLLQIKTLKSLAIRHYRSNYFAPVNPPIWTILEGLTFGTLSKVITNLNVRNRKLVAKQFDCNETVFASWVRSLVDFRNVAAQQGRLWNARISSNQPTDLRQHKIVFEQRDAFYSRAVVLAFFLKQIEPSSSWKQRLIELLEEHPFIDSAAMGFPRNWKSTQFWNT